MKKNSEYIGVDEKFVPENERYVKDSILGSREESKNKIKKGLKIGLGALVTWVLVVIVFFVVVVMLILNHSRKMNEQIFEFYDSAVEQMNNDTILEDTKNKMDEMQENIRNEKDKMQEDAKNKIDGMQDAMSSVMNVFMNNKLGI